MRTGDRPQLGVLFLQDVCLIRSNRARNQVYLWVVPRVADRGKGSEGWLSTVERVRVSPLISFVFIGKYYALSLYQAFIRAVKLSVARFQISEWLSQKCKNATFF